jgi:hypothetical protein
MKERTRKPKIEHTDEQGRYIEAIRYERFRLTVEHPDECWGLSRPASDIFWKPYLDKATPQTLLFAPKVVTVTPGRIGARQKGVNL